MKLQGRSLDEIPFKGMLYPYLPILGLALNVILALIQGWSYFKPFDAGNWVDAYILLPFSLYYILDLNFGINRNGSIWKRSI